MYSEKDFAGLFGPSDEEFRINFSKTLARLRAEESGRSIRWIHWKMIAVIAVVCAIAMTGVAYAVSQFNLRVVGQADDIDFGAAWKLVSVPKDYYEDVGEELSHPLYNNDFKKEQLPRFSEESAQALRILLANKIFMADGKPFDLIVLDTDSNEYYADSRGFVLYNGSGEELAEIRYRAIGYSGEPLGLEFRTKAEKDAQLEAELAGQFGVKLTSDYAEAARLLGQDFRLPTVYIEGVDTIEYEIQEGFTAIINGIDGGLEYGDTYGTAVYVRMNGDPGLYYFAEVKTGDDIATREWYAPGALIEECLIAEQTVYRILNDDMIRYAWEHDGLVYMIFQDKTDPNEFTDEQFFEIIWSMIQV